MTQSQSFEKAQLLWQVSESLCSPDSFCYTAAGDWKSWAPLKCQLPTFTSTPCRQPHLSKMAEMQNVGRGDTAQKNQYYSSISWRKIPCPCCQGVNLDLLTQAWNISHPPLSWLWSPIVRLYLCTVSRNLQVRWSKQQQLWSFHSYLHFLWKIKGEKAHQTLSTGNSCSPRGPTIYGRGVSFKSQDS